MGFDVARLQPWARNREKEWRGREERTDRPGGLGRGKHTRGSDEPTGELAAGPCRAVPGSCRGAMAAALEVGAGLAAGPSRATGQAPAGWAPARERGAAQGWAKGGCSGLDMALVGQLGLGCAHPTHVQRGVSRGEEGEAGPGEKPCGW